MSEEPISVSRYRPTAAELDILLPAIAKYFSLPARSKARHQFISGLLASFGQVSQGHWTEDNLSAPI
jgi:hypothetical protein